MATCPLCFREQHPGRYCFDAPEPRICARCGDGVQYLSSDDLCDGCVAEVASETQRDTLAGVELIAAERRRQVEAEGWTPEHDTKHWDGELALAAACYALPEAWRSDDIWPWHPGWWKPRPDDRVRELVKAGALIAAEIDRLRAQAVARLDHGITS